MKERRKSQRSQQDVQIRIEWEGKHYDGRLVDLSMTGAGCYVDKRFLLYSEVTVTFPNDEPFGDEPPFSCDATVVRCCKVGQEPEYQLGLFFTHLSEESLAQIMDLAYY